MVYVLLPIPSNLVMKYMNLYHENDYTDVAILGSTVVCQEPMNRIISALLKQRTNAVYQFSRKLEIVSEAISQEDLNKCEVIDSLSLSVDQDSKKYYTLMDGISDVPLGLCKLNDNDKQVFCVQLIEILLMNSAKNVSKNFLNPFTRENITRIRLLRSPKSGAGKPTKSQLYEKAKRMNISGRSKMTYQQLQRVTKT